MRTLPGRREPWLLCLLVITGQSAVLGLRDADWMGDPLWGQETLGIAQLLALPVIGGALAVAGWRDRTGILTLVPTGGPRRRHLARTWLSWAGPLAVCYVLAHAAVLLLSARAATSVDNASWWPLVTQLLGMGLAVVAGYATGYVTRSWTGAVTAPVALAAVLVLDRTGALPAGLAEYASSGTMLGAAPVASFFAARAGWLLAVTGAVAALLLLAGRGPRPLAAVPVAGLVAALVAGSVVFTPNDSYALTGPGDQYCSRGGPVRVCGPAELASRIDETAAVAGHATAALATLGVQGRTEFVVWTARAGDEDWVVAVQDRFRDPLDAGEVVDAVVAPTSCPMWRAAQPPPNRVFTAEEVLDGYVGEQVPGAPLTRMYTRFTEEVPEPAATRRLRKAAEGLQACDAETVPALFAAAGTRQ